MSVRNDTDSTIFNSGKAQINNIEMLDPTVLRIVRFDALSLSLKSSNGENPYDLLMGISGMAFRIQTLSREIWCPSCMGVDFGFKAFDQLMDKAPAIGLQVQQYNPEYINPSEINELIINSINNGVAVLATGPWWLGLIIGYERTSGDLLQFSVVTYEYPPQSPLLTTERPSSIFITNGELKYPDTDQAIESLQLALTLANTKKFEDYTSGKSAWREWMSHLDLDWDKDGYSNLIDSHKEDGGVSECHRRNMAWLASCRASACAYVRAISQVFPSEQSTLLQKASEAYYSISRLLTDGYKAQQWSAQGRALLEHAMHRAYDYEKIALDHIQQTLKLCGQSN